MRLVDVQHLVAVRPDEGEREVVGDRAVRRVDGEGLVVPLLGRERLVEGEDPGVVAAVVPGEVDASGAGASAVGLSVAVAVGLGSALGVCVRGASVVVPPVGSAGPGPACRRRPWARAPWPGPARPWSARCRPREAWRRAGARPRAARARRSPAAGHPRRRPRRTVRPRAPARLEHAREEAALAGLDRPVGARVGPPGPGEPGHHHRAERGRHHPLRRRAPAPRGESARTSARPCGPGSWRRPAIGSTTPRTWSAWAADVDDAPGGPGGPQGLTVLADGRTGAAQHARHGRRPSPTASAPISGTVTSTHAVMTTRAPGVSTRFSGEFHRCGRSPSSVGRMRW